MRRETVPPTERVRTTISPTVPRGVICALALLILLALPAIALAGDPTGGSTGGAGDVTAATAGSPTLEEVAAEVGHTKVALNYVWVLVACFLVMFMQAGLALGATGFTRAQDGPHPREA